MESDPDSLAVESLQLQKVLDQPDFLVLSQARPMPALILWASLSEQLDLKLVDQKGRRVQNKRKPR